MTTSIQITVNGQSVRADVAPRTHLADFVRERVGLTGTHLGCEHGVCGACVVLVDGQPVRSCITFAVACDGQSVTTVEGYRDDPLMSRLRAAFTAYHALQCGYCTPGMLASARDIALRLPHADERRVRAELSGNLCRCTGYQGIVDAVLSVLQALREQPDPAIEALRREMTERAATLPVVAAPPALPVAAAAALSRGEPNRALVPRSASPALSGTPAGDEPSAAIIEHFELSFPAEQVWALMSDPARVAACLPGAFLSGHDGDRVTGGVALRFGPMQARFEGEARLELRPADRQGRLLGRGRDRLTQSRAEGDIGWRVSDRAPGASSRVTIEMRYGLQGPLAQFSRGGLVQEFVRRIVRDFAGNLARALGEGQPGDVGGRPGGAAPQAAPAVNPFKILAAVLWSRVRRLFGAPD